MKNSVDILQNIVKARGGCEIVVGRRVDNNILKGLMSKSRS